MTQLCAVLCTSFNPKLYTNLVVPKPITSIRPKPGVWRVPKPKPKGVGTV